MLLPRSHQLTIPDNVRIYPETEEAGQLCPNPLVPMLPDASFKNMTSAMRHCVVCIALNHFVLSLPYDADKETAAIIRAKVYYHRGQAITALSKYVADEKTRFCDLTLSSVLMFMSMEVSLLIPCRHSHYYVPY